MDTRYSGLATIYGWSLIKKHITFSEKCYTCRLENRSIWILSGPLVIYTLDKIYDPNSMTLAQAVLELFCSQACIGL